MKRISVAFALALAVVLVSEHKASAWCSANFSGGINTGFQCGGVRLLWGVFETSPAPAPFRQPCCDPFGGCGPELQMAPAPLPAPTEQPKDPKDPKKTSLDSALPMPSQTGAMQQIQYNYYPQYQGYGAPGYWYDR